MSDALFHANCVAVEDNEESYLVGFADQEYDTQRYLSSAILCERRARSGARARYLLR